MSYEEEDTFIISMHRATVYVPYEEEDTCSHMSYEEEDTFIISMH